MPSDSTNSALGPRSDPPPTGEARDVSRLPVTPIEALMLARDRPGWPMTAQLEANVSGRLNRDRFEQALTATLAGHPLLRARIDSLEKPSCWLIGEPVLPPLDWRSEEIPLAFPGGRESIDLSRETGLRVWGRVGGEKGRIILQCHHACTDGIGVLTFFFDLLHAYHRHDAAPFVAPNDWQSPHLRDPFSGRGRIDRFRLLTRALVRGRRWRRIQSIPLGDHPPTPMPVAPMSTILARELPRELLDGLLATARAQGVTLNDLLLRDLLLVLARQSPAATVGPDDRLVLCMPVNCRRPDELRTPAMNKLMLSFLRRRPDECRDPEKLLRGIRAETSSIKRSGRGLTLLAILDLARRLAGGIPPGLLQKQSFATAALTNLGHVDLRAEGLPIDQQDRFRAGDLVIERIITAPNGQPGTPAVVVASTYAERLAITVCHNPRFLSRQSAEALLEGLVEQLHASEREGRRGQS